MKGQQTYGQTAAAGLALLASMPATRTATVSHMAFLCGHLLVTGRGRQGRTIGFHLSHQGEDHGADEHCPKQDTAYLSHIYIFYKQYFVPNQANRGRLFKSLYHG